MGGRVRTGVFIAGCERIDCHDPWEMPLRVRRGCRRLLSNLGHHVASRGHDTSASIEEAKGTAYTVCDVNKQPYDTRTHRDRDQ